jgi:transposase-like protein
MPRGVKRSEAERTRLVEAWQRSGLSQSAFARRCGLPPSTLSNWVRCTETHFVEVVVEEHSPAPELVVEMPRGEVVRVPAGFDGEDLQRLVAILRC